MKRITRFVTAALLCLSVLFVAMFPAYGAVGLFNGNQGSTTVSIQQASIIKSKTADLAIRPKSDAELKIVAEGSNLTYEWQLSADGGLSYGGVIGNGESYLIKNAQENTPVTQPYLYRVKVTGSEGQSSAAVIMVLVHGDYDYQTLTQAAGEVSVSAYMHKEAVLAVYPIAATDGLYAELAQHVDKGAGLAPYYAYEVKLINRQETDAPYFGPIYISFYVGSAFNGQTLRVIHKLGDSVETLSGTVSGGSLDIMAHSLSPFLIEAPKANINTITATAGINGSIAPQGEVIVADGGSKSFVISPNVGFAVDRVLVDGAPVTFTGNSYTFSDVMTDHTIAVSFRTAEVEGDTFTITAGSGSNGSISPNGSVSVKAGQSKTFYFYPDEGYEVDRVLVGGAEVMILGNSYTFTSVAEDSTVFVSFKKRLVDPPIILKNVVTTAGAGGSISPLGTTAVAYGGDLYVYFIPDLGYRVASVTVDGASVAASQSYHLVNITSDRTVHVEFERIPDASGGAGQGRTPVFYSLTVRNDDDAYGRVSPHGTIMIEKGGSQTVYFYPEEGYTVDVVTVNGKRVNGSSGSYTIQNIRGDTVVSVSFKPIKPAGSCHCALCAFWKGGCVCPWCWLAPLIVVSFAGLALLRHKPKKKGK